jgi:hypothetical protein
LPGPHGACIGAVEAGEAYDPAKSSKLPEITVTLIEEFLNE